MTDDNRSNFDSTQFYNSDEDEISVQDSLTLSHDPHLLYYQIIDKNREVEEENADIPQEYKERLRIFSNVDVFQSTMQYIEEFMIYFLSEFEGRENLVEQLTKTEPKEIKKFFELANKGDETEYLKQRGIEPDYESLIKDIFGYEYASEFESLEDEDYSELTIDPDSIEENIKSMIEDSVHELIEMIRSIGQFYLFFENAYNAAKHGKRVIPRPRGKMEIDTGEEGVTIPENDYVSFLCKDKRGEIFIFNYPADDLLNRSMKTAEKVHQIFKYLKRISEAKVNQSESVKVTFFGLENFRSTPQDDESSSVQHLKFTNPDSSTYVTSTEELDDLTSNYPAGRTIAARLYIHNDILQIHTSYEEEVSKKYPVEIRLTPNHSGRSEPLPRIDTNISFNMEDIDIEQFSEFVNIKQTADSNNIRRIDLHDDLDNQATKIGEPDSLQLPDFDEYVNLSSEEVETLRKCQLATNEHIPVPADLSSEQRSVVNSIHPSNMSQKEIESYLDKIREIGKDRVYTAIFVDEIDTEGTFIEGHPAGAFTGSVSFSVEVENNEDLNEDDELGDPNSMISFPVYDMSTSVERLLDTLSSDPSAINEILSRANEDTASMPEEKVPDLVVKAIYNEPTMWSVEHELRFGVITNAENEDNTA